MKRVLRKRVLLAVCVLFFCSTFPVNAHAEESDSLWKECTYTSTNHSQEGIRELWDANSSSDFIVEGPGELTISWEDQVPAKTLYLEWNTLPNDFTVTQHQKDGSVVETTEGETFELNQLYDLSRDTRSITLSSQTDMDLCTAIIFGPDQISENYHPWKATPDKLDYLVIVTHPDDDVIFMGAIVPIYGVERGLNGTIVYTCSSNIRYRSNEALNGAWAMGLRNHPIFAGFSNILPSQSKQRAKEFTVEKLTLSYVRILRQYKPEVVLTHDRRGEYGHWQHKNVSAAVCDAVNLAADTTYDPESAAQFGTFQVKKLYLHLCPENQIKLDVLSPLSKCNFQNVVEIATAAYEAHVSQVKAGHYSVSNEGVYSLADYGLYFSTVGMDTAGNDIFEHIDAESLSNYVPPTPTPSPTKAPMATPLVLEAALQNSAVPLSAMGRGTADLLRYVLLAVVVLIVCEGVAFVLLAMRKRSREKL